MRLPPPNALRAFEAAARHESFARAADELHVTQGAVSRHVKILEEHLGVALFRRRPQGVELTASGRTLLQAHRLVRADRTRDPSDLAERGGAAGGGGPDIRQPMARPAPAGLPPAPSQRARHLGPDERLRRFPPGRIRSRHHDPRLPRRCAGSRGVGGVAPGSVGPGLRAGPLARPRAIA